MALGSTITQVTDSGLKPGITFPSFVSSGVATATNFKTGTTDVHSTGVTVATSVVGSAVTSNATGVIVTGVTTSNSFVGALTGNVTGNASGTAGGLSGTPNITIGTLNASTGAFSSNVTISGNLGVAGTVTYEDVARVDATGISTFREGFGVGPLAGIALTTYKDGSIRTTGIITAANFYGNGANLTGIDATQIVTGNTSVQTVDTGSDGHVKVNTEGTERLRIASDGNVAIGNASPQQLLHVWPDTANTTSAYVRVTSGDRGSGTGIDLGSDADGDGRLNVVSNGNLKLYTNNTERLRIDSSGHIHTGYATNVTGADHVNILASDGGGVSVAQNNAGNATSGTTIGSYSFQGYHQGGATFASAEARISAIAAANHTGSSAATDLAFYTKPAATGPGSSPTERLRIGTLGQIGIAGANYGSSGQVITSGGSGAAVSWASASLSSESVQAEMVGDQSMGTGAWNLVKFNAQNWDTGNNYNHATGEWYYQAPSNGKYWYKVNLRLNALGSGKELDVVLYKSTDNGGSYTLQKKSQRWVVTPNGGAITVETTGLMSLDEDDRIRAYSWHNHGSNRDLDDNWCLFEVFRLGD